MERREGELVQGARRGVLLAFDACPSISTMTHRSGLVMVALERRCSTGDRPGHIRPAARTGPQHRLRYRLRCNAPGTLFQIIGSVILDLESLGTARRT